MSQIPGYRAYQLKRLKTRPCLDLTLTIPEQRNRENFIKEYGSDKFEWKISPKIISENFHVIIMRKYDSLSDIFNGLILRMTEGQLLSIAQPINLIPDNTNPHQ